MYRNGLGGQKRGNADCASAWRAMRLSLLTFMTSIIHTESLFGSVPSVCTNMQPIRTRNAVICLPTPEQCYGRTMCLWYVTLAADSRGLPCLTGTASAAACTSVYPPPEDPICIMQKYIVRRETQGHMKAHSIHDHPVTGQARQAQCTKLRHERVGYRFS